jgi:hypothetical protein
MIPHPDLAVAGLAAGCAACTLVLLVRRPPAWAPAIAAWIALLVAAASVDLGDLAAVRWAGPLSAVVVGSVLAGAGLGAERLVASEVPFAPRAALLAAVAAGVALTVPDTELPVAVAAALGAVAIAAIALPRLMRVLVTTDGDALAGAAGVAVALAGAFGSGSLADATSTVVVVGMMATVAVPGRRTSPWPAAAVAGAAAIAVSRLTVRIDGWMLVALVGLGVAAVAAAVIRALPPPPIRSR